MCIRILIADNHEIMRNGLCSLFEREAGMEVVGEASNGRSIVQLTKKLKPDVVIMDITMPGLNGIEATRQIISFYSNMKVIALSMHSDKRFTSGMLRVGASGYLTKDKAFSELIHAIHTVLEGKIYLSPSITKVVVKDYLNQLFSSCYQFTEVQKELEKRMLKLLIQGKSSKQIAEILNMSLETINTYRHLILKKLDIDSIAGLTKYGIREGLTSLKY